MARPSRPDRSGSHRQAYSSNRIKILKTQSTCAICGQPVNKKLKPPDPLSPCIDHIIPVSKGGHPSAIENLQLAHMTCNRQKSDKLFASDNTKQGTETKKIILGNRNLPKSKNWKNYKGDV